jgi:hypothetical protein
MGARTMLVCWKARARHGESALKSVCAAPPPTCADGGPRTERWQSSGAETGYRIRSPVANLDLRDLVAEVTHSLRAEVVQVDEALSRPVVPVVRVVQLALDVLQIRAQHLQRQVQLARSPLEGTFGVERRQQRRLLARLASGMVRSTSERVQVAARSQRDARGQPAARSTQGRRRR